ncbi:MAG: hypothetical protein ACR2NO_12640 [Chloroflexota bacterium]
MVAATEVRSTAGRVVMGTQTRSCARCGAQITRRRRNAQQNEELCSGCDQRDRRAAYFRSYYANHKDRILHKNRRWAKDNKTRIVQLRQARRVRDPSTLQAPRTCVDCDSPVTRAIRCRKCYIRFRYANDAAYRARRLATTRRWLEKRQDTSPLRRASGRASSHVSQFIAN